MSRYHVKSFNFFRFLIRNGEGCNGRVVALHIITLSRIKYPLFRFLQFLKTGFFRHISQIFYCLECSGTFVNKMQ